MLTKAHQQWRFECIKYKGSEMQCHSLHLGIKGLWRLNQAGVIQNVSYRYSLQKDHSQQRLWLSDFPKLISKPIGS